MKSCICSVALAFALAWAAAAAAGPPATGAREPDSELSFLKPGKDYVIRFPENITLFSHKSGGMSPTSFVSTDGTKSSGSPATWSMTMSLQIFHVVRLGSGSWALLEHPEKYDDFFKWSAKRRAMAVLAGNDMRKVESAPDGKKRLEELRKEAAQEVETDETWVNLDHAVAIAEVPTKDQKYKWSLKSVTAKPSK